ncbi:MAG: TAT-variant-translocated molybdopterin oxidoreductase [Polyangiales bacterium]
MKRLPILSSQDLSGKQYWRSLADQAGDPQIVADRAREFPEGAAELPDDESGVSRRGFMSIMGAAAALSGLAACRRPEEKIIPYSHAPEDVVPGNALYYATAVAAHGTAFGLIVESHEGRPTKIEGNLKHPDSLGATDAWIQSTVLDMYDPDRSASPLLKGQKQNWDDAAAAIRALGDGLRGKQGKGLAILTEAHRSPTLARMLEELKKALPLAKTFRWEAFSRFHSLEGSRLAFGKRMERVHETGKAKVIAAFDADLFLTDGSPIKQARGWAEGREPEKEMNRLYVFESAFSVTGGSADHRVRCTSRQVAAAVLELAKQLGAAAGVDSQIAAIGDGAAPLGDKAKKAVAALAKELVKNKGASLVVAGEKQPPAVHAVVAAINVALGNVGKTVDYVPAFSEESEGPAALVELAKGLTDKSIDTVLILGGNPAFDAPADLKLDAALKGAANVLHLSTHFNETSELAGWHLNRAHYLEAWGDLAAEDGTSSIVQPLIAPLYDGKSDLEVVSLLLGESKRGYDLVRATWQEKKPSADWEVQWRRWVHEGLIADTTLKAEEATLNAVAITAAARTAAVAPAPAAGGYEVTFQPDTHVYDGRFANSAWMQEFPDPMSKITWGNVAYLSPATAAKIGVADGDHLTLSGNGATVTLPAMMQPGLADDSIAVMLGHGRTKVGAVGKGGDNQKAYVAEAPPCIGVNTYPLRASTAPYVSTVISVAKGAGSTKLAQTQEHFATEGRPLVREASVVLLKANPKIIEEMVEHPPLVSSWKEWEYNGHKWGLAIDLNQCTGCGTCMIACQAENNIPTVGARGVQFSREMHWIRVDRYYEGEKDDPITVSQPLPCQHCENAPCEQVCPVGATSHSPEGTNDMVYNRCIGTRYCANNCPYKVRRFNFYNYAKDVPEQRKMQFNPDVTVRSRGVMEKCTLCIQRINEARIDAHKRGEERVKDGVISTACEQACPTRAITFGDLNDPTSRVTKKVKTEIGYHLLEELNTKTRVTYLARIRNPNPELA